MSTLGWIVIGLLATTLAGVAAFLMATRRRLTRVDARVTTLERRLANVGAASAQALDTARDAAVLARQAATGDEAAAPRVVLEPVTGRVVRALALGAGARRAVAHLARSARTGPG